MASSSSSTISVLKELSSSKCFGGFVKKFSHDSVVCDCVMKFSVYIPETATSTKKVPAILWLSGLTCNEDNFIQKSGAIAFAAKWQIALICPDTSPRGCNIEGEDDHWDFGTGAGYYVNATVAKWRNYQMYDYVVKELPLVVCRELPIDEKNMSISGHSVGGHGALVVGLRNSRQFKCISAFAPMANPIECPWGKKAFSNYLGDDQAAWQQYDAVHLLQHYDGDRVDVLVDQGSADNFLAEQLGTPALRQAAALPNNASVVVRMQSGYDHGFFFISTFIESHIEFHARRLGINVDGEPDADEDQTATSAEDHN